ncbi:Hypothetical predicted protein [Mytilus galloprovincialis]|uniref:Uncharacterized protein n=1 Tax=Mytilus galloprovincialis TaxID=29158 RepID=A0A8B6E3L0_MYTGA|nr:Hypothetical predicted protein [Mytilus galloprovincialis]
MNNKYLKFHEGVYGFIHPCLVKVMLLSSESMVHYLLTNGSLHDITEFVRSDIYIALGDELVIKIGEEYHQTLCERLARHAFESHSLLQHVAQYIYSYWRSTGNNFVNKMFKHIEFIMFRSLAVHTGDILAHDAESLSENSINLEDSVHFSKIIMLLDQLTYKGRDPWIFGPGTTDFIIISALVSAAKNRYATDRVKAFEILLEEFQDRKHFESFVKLWSKPLDLYGNNFFHYLMVLSQKEASEIISKMLRKYTPLDSAAFLGKIDIFKVLNLKTFNCTNKLRKRLKSLAKSGKIAYYKENSENIKIKQPMIHKTIDDSASPCSSEKLECEEADINDKKELIDDNKKDKRFLKRKSSLRNEEPKKEEQHDREDVLSFGDFWVNIVDNWKIEDYQLIIKLLSK